MKAKTKTLNNHYRLAGPLFWVASIQYFVVQLIVGYSWKLPYSISRNTISDLGNTACGTYGGRQVCSPQHVLMNASFIILGCTMLAGAYLIYSEFKPGRAAATGFTGMALAGFGTILVGAFPENTIGVLHAIGAAMPFFVGNIGMIILGSGLSIPKNLRVYTILSGLIALMALGFFLTGHYLGLGDGGMERLTGYPQTIWLIIFGLYMLRRYFKAVSVK